MALIKDPELTSRCNDAVLRKALTSAGLDPDARVAASVKYASRTTLDAEHYILVDSYNVSCRSTRGPIDAEEDYVGLVLYAKGGEVDWHCNGVHCQSGYIYYRKTSEIQHISSHYGQVHGKLYKSLFDEEPRGVVASGFSIRQGQWRWKSGTFNHWLPAGMQTTMMDEKERVFVKAAVQKFANTGAKVSRIADHRQLFLLCPDTILLRRGDVASLTGLMAGMLISEGHDNIAARASSSGRSVKNSIHFEVSWHKGGKPKSIYMRKPPHYLVYQLTLDIEAHTNIAADSQQLSLYGAELQPFQRLSSCGVGEGDIIQLNCSTGKQAVAQLGGRTSKLLGRLLAASGDV